MLDLLFSTLVNLLVIGICLGTIFYICFLSGTPKPDSPEPHAQDEGDRPAVSHDSPAGERNQNVATGRTTARSPVTYRLLGIPVEISETDIPNLLRKAWEIPESTEIWVHSLAANPHLPEEKVATISFSEVPTSIQPLKDTEWVSRVNEDLELVLDTHFRGFTPLHSSPDENCSLDCITVSGLGGHPFGSFKSKNKSPKTKNHSFMWLRDALPRALPQSRIFIYGHDAESANSKSFGNIIDIGAKLQHSIYQIRPSKTGLVRPLVLIGHSLGGLVVKEAVINMGKRQTEDDEMNLQSLRAALFFGVPTLGMDIGSIIPMVQGKPNEHLVKSLDKTSDIPRRLQEQFDKVSQRVPKYWYYETKQSPTAKLVGSQWSMTGPDTVLVDAHSATNGRSITSSRDLHFVEPINCTHSEMVKFPHRKDSYYMTVAGHLKKIEEGIQRGKNGRIRYPLTDSQFECMRSLAIENQESRKRSIDLVPNTCEWIESHPIFRAWEGSRTGTLWIRGQPGSGKSCLMKYLTDLLDRETPNIASPVVASFFFHGTGSEVQRSLSGFYRAVLNQLVAEIPRCCDEILRKFAEDQSKLGEKSTWETQELRGFLSSTLSEAISAGIPIIILADALDEAGQSNAMELMQFFRDIENTATKTTDVIYGSLRVCFSCRPYPIIVGQKHSLIIDVGEHNKADLSMFVRNKLKPDPSVWIEDNDLTEVQDKIIVKSSRTFQWAKLMIQVVLRMLTEMATKSQIQDQISKTPPDIHQLYSQLLSSTVPDGKGNTKYSPRDQALTLKLFQWLCFSNGPLTLSMIQHVLVLGAEEPDIACPSEHRDFQPLRAMATAVTKLSRGLVEIRSQNWIRGTSKEIVQFTHHSVYDFLLETGLADLSGSEIAKLEPTVRATKVVCLGHFQISKACIQAMAMQDTGVFVEAHLPLRLIDARQFRRLCPNTHDVREIMAAFRFPDCCYSSNLCAVVQSTATRLHESLTTDEIWPPFDNPEDLQDFMDSLEQHSEEMIPVALYGSQYLCHHLKAVESCDWNQMNLLDLFPGSNLMKTWPRIAELGSHPEMPGLEAGSSITHVLAGVGIASALKHCLGQDPRSCSIEDRLGKIPLHHAIENDENDSIKLLIQEALERGCIDMINHPDHEGRTPLHYALEYGMEETAQILIREALDHGTIDINRPDHEGRTPLHYALEHSGEETVQILIREALDHGAIDINRPDHEGRTPLHYAIEHGEEEVAQTLIQEAVDGGIVEIDSPDRKGRTPIFIIACVGNEDDMRQLLRTGMVNVERKDSTGQTPLAVAAKLGRTEIARLLVDTGASVESKDNSGCTPVFQAVRESTLEMTRYLVEEAFAKVDVLDNKGRGILSHAAEGGNIRIAEYIFTIAPTQLEVEDKNGKIPILYTSMEPGRGDAFDFLIKHMDPRSEAFLFKAAEYGFKGLLDYIFERGGPFDLEVLEQAMRIVQRPRKETARDSTILTHIERRINVEIIKTRMRKSRSNRS